MARKRHDHDRPGRRRSNPTPASPPSEPPGMPDRRALEGHLRQFLGMQEEDPSSPRARAQALLDQAFDSPEGPERVLLAQQALTAWPDCADAYVLLAEHARTRREALAFYEQGVAAGERALGPEVFRDQVGHFWGIL